MDRETTPASRDDRYLLVRAGGDCCAVPASAVRRVVRNLPCHPFPGERSHFVGFAQFGGEPLAVLDLHALITGEAPRTHHGATVILGRGPRRSRSVIGLAVDETIRVANLRERTENTSSDEFVRGTVELEGDRVVMIDPSRLLVEWKRDREELDG